jgi:putative phosphoribosyl transferase
VDRLEFYDRQSAGVLLGIKIAKANLAKPVVLGLPRGGLPVAAKVAEALGAPLDVIVVRKLGVPHRPELAMGAIGEDGVIVLNHDVLRNTHVTDDALHEVEVHERAELESRVQRLRTLRPRESLVGISAVIVDDGIATGATVRAAIRVARAHGARSVTVAAPVAPPDVVEMLRDVADRVECLAEPDPFWAVGSWYRHFDAVSDDEVVRLIIAAYRPDGALASAHQQPPR